MFVKALGDDARHPDGMLVRKQGQARDDGFRIVRQVVELEFEVPPERVGVVSDVGRRAEFAFFQRWRGTRLRHESRGRRRCVIVARLLLVDGRRRRHMVLLLLLVVVLVMVIPRGRCTAERRRDCWRLTIRSGRWWRLIIATPTPTLVLAPVRRLPVARLGTTVRVLSTSRGGRAIVWLRLRRRRRVVSAIAVRRRWVPAHGERTLSARTPKLRHSK